MVYYITAICKGIIADAMVFHVEVIIEFTGISPAPDSHGSASDPKLIAGKE